jgi:tape measure domain-containing protein
MATETNTVKISIKTFGNDELKKLNATFGRINKTLVLNKKSLNDTVASILRVDKRAKSFNGGLAKSNKIIQDQIAAFKVLRDQVDKGGAAYSRFTNEINKLNTSLRIQPNANAYAMPIGPQMDTRGRFAKMRDRFIGSAKNMGVGSRAALGAIAGAGVAGNLGAVGSFGLSGAAVGGPMGAAVGAGLGLAAEGLKFGAESARYASEIQKLQIALKGVTKNGTDFAKGLEVINTTSKRLNVPIAASTKQFTTLSASVLGAGGTIEDAELVFTGVSNAIKATGGNAEDVQSAIRAMSQIFGKGKVSAEELQGQLGERLAGAVVKFAEANGSSLAKLQKDLRDGTVGLDQVIKFAEKLNVDFSETAEKVANSSADAGQRLKTTMDRLKLAVGTILQPIGAEFQRVFANIVGAITDAIEAFNRFLGIGLGNAITKTEQNIKSLEKRLETTTDRTVRRRLQTALKNAEKKLAELQGDMKDEEGKKTGLPDLDDNKKSPLESFAESAFKFANQAEQAVVNAFKGMEDALVKFVTTGKLNFADLARSIIADITRIAVRAFITKPLFSSIFPNIEFAKGGVIDAGNKITAYARGGIVDKPTLFPMANGAGLMGEAGPEGVLPLKRGKDGKLGVMSQGGGSTNIVVNVDASGSTVEGDEQGGRELGRLISVAIQSELINQKRPGGLLA